MDVTFLAQARTTGRCTIRPECQVVYLEAAADDRVARVHYIDPDGEGGAVSARAVVVACGAVQTPRRCLSGLGEPARPSGARQRVGPGSAGISMETIFWAGSGLHPAARQPQGRPPTRSVDRRPRCRSPVARAGEPLVSALAPGRSASSGRLPMRCASFPAGRAHKARMREVFGGGGRRHRRMPARAASTSIPRRRTSMACRSPASTVIWRKARSAASLSWPRACGAICGIGVSRTWRSSSARDHIFASTHVFGTCRMGHDPEVVLLDSTRRSHRWRNLYVSKATRACSRSPRAAARRRR